jgi:hypothetical protein
MRIDGSPNNLTAEFLNFFVSVLWSAIETLPLLANICVTIEENQRGQ